MIHMIWLKNSTKHVIYGYSFSGVFFMYFNEEVYLALEHTKRNRKNNVAIRLEQD
jgi:hypothetical protein